VIASLRPWTWTSSTWAGLQFLVLVIAALVAWRQVREARRLREDQARPFVVIDLVAWQTIAEFQIKNIGLTIARDVRFEFDPPLVSSRDSRVNRKPLAETNLFKQGIPTLPPGKTVNALFDTLPSRIKEGLPDDYSVRVSYKDALGKEHAETTTVGYGFLRDVGRITRRDMHDVHRRLEEIAREVKKWTVLGSALKVMTPADIERYNEELDAYYAEREAEAQNETTVDDSVTRLDPEDSA
jgi:hypothetical protein